MPTYDYVCESCSNEFEVFKSILDDEPRNCPNCNSTHTHIIPRGGSGYIMKGGTRRATVKQRHGHKKQESTSTPMESALAKAQDANSARDAGSSDPYAAFRN